MTEEEIKSRIKNKLFITRILSLWPFLVWVGVIAIAVWSQKHSQLEQTFLGRVVMNTLIVSTTEDSIVHSINVQPGQTVSSGSILAELDTSKLDFQIEELTIEIQQGHRERERRYLEARHRLIEQHQDLLLKQTEDQALLAVLSEEDVLLEDLHTKRLIERKLYVNNRAIVETLSSSIDTYPSLIAEIENEMQLLESSKSIWNIEDSSLLLKDDARLQLLKKQREDRVLFTKNDGTVSQVFANKGETVLAGKPILSLVLKGNPRITAFIPETTLELPQQGDILYITTMTQKGNWVPATVTHLAPDVIVVPDQASPLPGNMITGRYCYLKLIQPAKLVNGETVQLVRTKPSFFSFLKSGNSENSVALSKSPLHEN